MWHGRWIRRLEERIGAVSCSANRAQRWRHSTTVSVSRLTQFLAWKSIPTKVILLLLVLRSIELNPGPKSVSVRHGILCWTCHFITFPAILKNQSNGFRKVDWIIFEDFPPSSSIRTTVFAQSTLEILLMNSDKQWLARSGVRIHACICTLVHKFND